jgi:hypothetical protein
MVVNKHQIFAVNRETDDFGQQDNTPFEHLVDDFHMNLKLHYWNPILRKVLNFITYCHS